MIIAYATSNNFQPQTVDASNLALLADASWIDLVFPSKEEEGWIEHYCALEIPTQEEMREIESSSRLFIRNKTLFMTATMIAQSDSLNPQYDAVTFALMPNKLITIRYIEPQAFRLFSSQLAKSTKNSYRPVEVFISLLEATIDRLADVLEVVGHNLDEYSKHIFQYDHDVKNLVKLNYRQVMQKIGVKSNLNTKVRESLITFTRLITFFRQTEEDHIEKEEHARLVTLNADVSSLSDYANFISNKINFLLDATLGMINIEQSSVIKILSVAAVIFLPPTLVASIYGMNFKFMPGLSFKWGYELAILLMIISAWLPYRYFKYRRWL